MTDERMVEFHEPDQSVGHQPGWGLCVKCGLVIRLRNGQWLSGKGYRTCPQ